MNKLLAKTRIGKELIRLREINAALADELRARDKFNDDVLEENEDLANQIKELKAEVEEWKDACKLRDEQFDEWQRDAKMWQHRWQDEHEKYDDLCSEVRSYVNSIDSFRDALMATTTIDT